MHKPQRHGQSRTSKSPAVITQAESFIPLRVTTGHTDIPDHSTGEGLYIFVGKHPEPDEPVQDASF